MKNPESLRIRWRPASVDDSQTLWRWRNDPMTRRNSLQSGRIGWDSHRRWLAGKLADRGCLLLIALGVQGEPVGQLRLDRGPAATAEVSISVAPEHRGRGLAAAMLRRAPWGRPAWRLRRLLAQVKPENAASVIAFIKSGYRFTRVRHGAGGALYLLERRLGS